MESWIPHPLPLTLSWFPWRWLRRYTRATNHVSAWRAEGARLLQVESGRENRKQNMTTDSTPPTPTWMMLQPHFPLRGRVGPRRMTIKKNRKIFCSMAETANRAKGERAKGNEVYSKWTLKWPTNAGTPNDVHTVTQVTTDAINKC